jgi:hypothetical protein
MAGPAGFAALQAPARWKWNATTAHWLSTMPAMWSGWMHDLRRGIDGAAQQG